MGVPPVGSVILVNFPFADLKRFKKRPAVVIAGGSLDTIILCQITSQDLPGVIGIKLENRDFAVGGLPMLSYVRPDKLFTVDGLIKHHELGVLSTAKTKTIRRHIAELFA